jgi:iron complex transport system substrate-binding protein
LSRPGWGAVSAVRDDRIYEIKSTYILQPGPASLTDGVRQIHDVLRGIFNTKDTKDTKAETD